MLSPRAVCVTISNRVVDSISRGSYRYLQTTAYSPDGMKGHSVIKLDVLAATCRVKLR